MNALLRGEGSGPSTHGDGSDPSSEAPPRRRASPSAARSSHTPAPPSQLVAWAVIWVAILASVAYLMAR